MTTKTMRWMLSIVLGVLVSSIVAAATPKPLTDSQLDGVYAAGFDIRVDLDIDVAASNPDAVLIQGGGGNAALHSYVDRGLTVARSMTGTRNTGSMDAGGTYMPNLQNLTTSTVSLGAGALQNATSLLNVFALDGNLNIGVNFNVIINQAGSPINITQTNVNGGTLVFGNGAYNPIGD